MTVYCFNNGCRLACFGLSALAFCFLRVETSSNDICSIWWYNKIETNNSSKERGRED